MFRITKDSPVESFLFQANTPEKTFELGRLIALTVDFRKAQENKQVLCVTIDGTPNIGKSTLLAGVANSLTGVSQEVFCDHQLEPGIRFFKEKTEDGFFVSYDLLTYGLSHDPNDVIGEGGKGPGVVCIEHGKYKNLGLYGLSPNISIYMNPGYSSEGDSSSRRIDVLTASENVSVPSFQQFLKRAEAFTLG